MLRWLVYYILFFVVVIGVASLVVRAFDLTPVSKSNDARIFLDIKKEEVSVFCSMVAKNKEDILVGIGVDGKKIACP